MLLRAENVGSLRKNMLIKHCREFSGFLESSLITLQNSRMKILKLNSNWKKWLPNCIIFIIRQIKLEKSQIWPAGHRLDSPDVHDLELVYSKLANELRRNVPNDFIWILFLPAFTMKMMANWKALSLSSSVISEYTSTKFSRAEQAYNLILEPYWIEAKFKGTRNEKFQKFVNKIQEHALSKCRKFSDVFTIFWKTIIGKIIISIYRSWIEEASEIV